LNKEHDNKVKRQVIAFVIRYSLQTRGRHWFYYCLQPFQKHGKKIAQITIDFFIFAVD
jgi:hypothetical protein